MTKATNDSEVKSAAQEALKDYVKTLDGKETYTYRDYGYDIEVLEPSTWKTIREALELLDKVQKGGVKFPDVNNGEGLKGYQYSSGPVWFTHVEKEPKMSRINKDGTYHDGFDIEE